MFSDGVTELFEHTSAESKDHQRRIILLRTYLNINTLLFKNSLFRLGYTEHVSFFSPSGVRRLRDVYVAIPLNQLNGETSIEMFKVYRDAATPMKRTICDLCGVYQELTKIRGRGYDIPYCRSTCERLRELFS